MAEGMTVEQITKYWPYAVLFAGLALTLIFFTGGPQIVDTQDANSIATQTEADVDCPALGGMWCQAHIKCPGMLSEIVAREEGPAVCCPGNYTGDCG